MYANLIPTWLQNFEREAGYLDTPMRCEDCGWEGDASECKRYVPVYERRGIDMMREDRCPKCDSFNLQPKVVPK